MRSLDVSDQVILPAVFQTVSIPDKTYKMSPAVIDAERAFEWLDPVVSSLVKLKPKFAVERFLAPL